jgi:CubicO group peptidase (beta-lactamase class C family)
LLPALLLFLSSAPTIAQSVAPATPLLAERLDRRAAEFDRNRIDLHGERAVLAIGRGEDVIFARGFGIAGIKKQAPITPDTQFKLARSNERSDPATLREVGVELAPDTFTLQPSAESGQGK